MIGIFDSGVGGLTVARALRRELPEYDLIYFGDTARTPYGNKSKEVILRYALEDADFLIQRGAKMIVIACNTASSLAYEALKEKYPNMPIFEVIGPAVEEAKLKGKRVGVVGTRATIGSGAYAERLGDLHIISKSCPLFVPFIEEGITRGRELKMITRRYLADLKNKNIDTLILGCTHYPIIKDIIGQRMGERVTLIDSAVAIAKKVKEYIKNNNTVTDTAVSVTVNSNTVNLEYLGKNEKIKIYFSDLTPQVSMMARKLVGNDIIIEQHNNENNHNLKFILS